MVHWDEIIGGVRVIGSFLENLKIGNSAATSVPDELITISSSPPSTSILLAFLLLLCYCNCDFSHHNFVIINASIYEGYTTKKPLIRKFDWSS